jgi:hypothetical protein
MINALRARVAAIDSLLDQMANQPGRVDGQRWEHLMRQRSEAQESLEKTTVPDAIAEQK